MQKWIERNGGRGGMHHVGFRVEDIQAAFDYLTKQGYNIIDPSPRPGSRGTTVFFLHPKSKPDHPFGILVEIVEDPEK